MGTNKSQWEQISHAPNGGKYHNFIKYDKYAFQKYVVFKCTNTLFQNTTGKKANTLIFALNVEQPPVLN